MVKASDKDWKGIIIDGRGHLYGRLATIVAKQLLHAGSERHQSYNWILKIMIFFRWWEQLYSASQT
jgi:hypothetical protein